MSTVAAEAPRSTGHIAGGTDLPFEVFLQVGEADIGDGRTEPGAGGVDGEDDRRRADREDCVATCRKREGIRVEGAAAVVA